MFINVSAEAICTEGNNISKIEINLIESYIFSSPSLWKQHWRSMHILLIFMFCFYKTKRFFATGECKTWLSRSKDVLYYCFVLPYNYSTSFSAVFKYLHDRYTISQVQKTRLFSSFKVFTVYTMIKKRYLKTMDTFFPFCAFTCKSFSIEKW